MSKPKPQTAKQEARADGEPWYPIEELPLPDAKTFRSEIQPEYLVRFSVKGRPVRAKFKQTRAYVPEAMRYETVFILVDPATGMKLPTKPREFQVAPAEASAA